MTNILDLKLSPDVIDSLSRNRCVNRVHMLGRIATRPKVTNMSKTLKKTSFYIVLAETWTNRSTGKRMHHLNVVNVEVLGQDSERASGFLVGWWVAVDGYLRTDTQGSARTTSIRTYAVRSWESDAEIGDQHGSGEESDALRGQGVPGASRAGGIEVLGKSSRRARGAD
jgi:single-stranded DNA-binding protein